LVFACAISRAAHADSAAPQQVRFSLQIRPLLSDRCFSCHGPEDRSRQADLRLDNFAGATKDLGGHAAIVPGSPDKSEILTRVASNDPDVQMPPPSAHKERLTKDEVALLRKWIAQGAKYEAQWSLLPMQKVEPPALPKEKEKQVVNEIDRFVIAKLLEQKL